MIDWLIEPHVLRMRALRYRAISGTEHFASIISLSCNLFKTRTYERYEWNERENTRLTTAVDDAIFRSSANKDEQDLSARKNSNASEGFNSGRRLQLLREVRKLTSWAKSSTSQESQKQLKSQRQQKSVSTDRRTNGSQAAESKRK